MQKSRDLSRVSNYIQKRRYIYLTIIKSVARDRLSRNQSRSGESGCDGDDQRRGHHHARIQRILGIFKIRSHAWRRRSGRCERTRHFSSLDESTGEGKANSLFDITCLQLLGTSRLSQRLQTLQKNSCCRKKGPQLWQATARPMQS